MRYTFNDIFNAELYEKSRVIFVLGKHTIFKNIVCDELKRQCVKDDGFQYSAIVVEEFGLEDDGEMDGTSVDFNTFMAVIGVPSINGRWYCRTDLSVLTKNQKKTLESYMKDPSDNGLLVITSDNWRDYSFYMRNKVLNISNVSNYIELSFPNKDTLKKLVKQMFEDKGVEINSAALDFFLTRMSQAYDKYNEVIDDIVDWHKEELGGGIADEEISMVDMKRYMKGIEYYVIDDLLYEVVKPLHSNKTNNKKVLRVMVALEDAMTAKTLVYQLLKNIDESIEFRVLINMGIIPIGLNYFFNDVIKDVKEVYGEKHKISNMSESVFRRKADLASRTSLRDWEYMKIILKKAIENNRVSEEITDGLCRKALYELCTRSILTESRINNILGIEDILNKGIEDIDNIRFERRKSNE